MTAECCLKLGFPEIPCKGTLIQIPAHHPPPGATYDHICEGHQEWVERLARERLK